MGYDVLVSDVREDYVEGLNKRQIQTNEPEVETLLKNMINRTVVDNRQVVRECDLIYTLVPTPSLDDGSYDVSVVYQWSMTSRMRWRTLPILQKTLS